MTDTIAHAHMPTEVRCPTCQLGWWLNPPVKCNGSNHYRCVECKAVYSGEMLAAPDMLEALRAFADIRIERATEWAEQNEPWPDDRRLVGYDNWYLTVGMVKAVRAALAKATGARETEHHAAAQSPSHEPSKAGA